jgi:hypothetical protein
LVGFAAPTTCVFRFSQPPDAFIRPGPTGHVSCRIRSWVHPTELFPLTQPYAVSSAASLLTF